MAARPAEFIDSGDVAHDGDELRARMREHGYVFLRGLLDPDAVAQVRADVLARALAPLGWLAAGSDPADARPDTLIRREADDNWWGGYEAIQRLESFHRLGHDPTLVSTMARILGEDDVLVHPRKIARVTYPNNQHPTPPHQDYPYLQGSSDVLTVWIPFGDVPVEMGGLRLLQGSHRSGLQEPVSAQGIGGIGVEADESDPDWRGTDYRMGDAVVFFSFTVHWAPPNEGDRMRLSGDYRYQPLADPVLDGSLRPHQYPRLPDWDLLTAGWSTTRWIDSPPGLDVVDVRAPDRTLTAPASRFLAV